MFYDRFEELCREKGVRITRACQDMGLSRSLASKWKNTGTEKPSADVLERMSLYFGISINEILNVEKKTGGESFPPDEEEQKKEPAPEIVDLGDELNADFVMLWKKLTPEERVILRAQMRGMLSDRES